VAVVGISMVKDEEDVIEATLLHMLNEVDHVIVADNMSTDRTRDILDALQRMMPDRLTVLDDPEPAYRQSEKMTALAHYAHAEHGADWLVPFDADEWWYSPFGSIRIVLEDIAPQWLVVPAPLYDYVATGDDDRREHVPTRRIQWRRPSPAPLHKVACRWREDLVIEQGNHSASYNGRATLFDPLLTIKHFPYRSEAQFKRKARNGAAAYAAAGPALPESMGAHWRQWGQLSDEQLSDVFRTWYFRDDPKQALIIDGEHQPALVFDPLP
jgi:glycosyltransferase involved in cell wall biosynthesis